VAATAGAILEAAGWTTGVFTTPSLYDATGADQTVNGQPVAGPLLQKATEHVRAALSGLLQARGIERLETHPRFADVATRLLAFSLADVDVAVVEALLGGRSCPTNAVDPSVSVVTNIGADHLDRLGSLWEVAEDKSAIIKSGAPAIVGETDPDLLAILERRAVDVGSPLTVVPPDAPQEVEVDLDGTRFTLPTDRWGSLDLHTPLVGRFQAHNTALAVRAVEALPDPLRPGREAVREGVSTAFHPGRLQVVRSDRPGEGITWVLDIASNPPAVEALTASLRELDLPGPVVAVAACLARKDPSRVLGPVGSYVDHLIVTCPADVEPDRAADADAVLSRVGGGEAIRDPVRAFVAARDRAAPEGTVLVVGGLDVVRDAFRLLDGFWGRRAGGCGL
jgi:dihydrofolate synthase/folylpolyglutamate synthase